MTVLQTQQKSREHHDQWASQFFQALLDQRLSVAEFEQAVQGCWDSGDFILRAPRTADWLRELATSGDRKDAGYAHDAPNLGFRSQWLIGVHGQPGAIHILAPEEQSPRAEFPDLNRPPHRHDSGRIAIVTRGKAVFHAVRTLPGGETVVLDCPVETGDVILWPAWTPHTFNAKQGFWLVSAMASYVSPDEDGFVFPLEETLDGVPRSPYSSKAR